MVVPTGFDFFYCRLKRLEINVRRAARGFLKYYSFHSLVDFPRAEPREVYAGERAQRRENRKYGGVLARLRHSFDFD